MPQQCPHCGHPNAATDLFCDDCGRALSAAAQKAATGTTGSLEGPLPVNTTLGVGRYTVGAAFGQGGVGRVYPAFDAGGGAGRCVVKEFDPLFVLRNQNGNVKAVQAFRTLFVREAQVLARLRHPGMPAAWDLFEEHGRTYLVEDYIEGQDLSKLDRPVPEPRLLEYAIQICDVLSYVHGQRPPVIHRDIKPENIRLTTAGKAVLMDFGAAREYKLGQSGDTQVLGTRIYAPPEAINQTGQSSGQSDLYSLGVTLYELATGADENFLEINMFRLPPARTKNPGLTAEFEAILRRATENDRSRRFGSAEEMAEALRELHAKLAARTCDRCGHLAPKESSACPKCGRPLGKVPARDWATAGGSVRRTGFVHTSFAPGMRQRWCVPVGSPVSATPVVVQGTAYAATQDGRVLALDARTGRIVWVAEVGEPFWAALTAHHEYLWGLTNAGSLVAIQRGNGTVAWRQSLLREVFSGQLLASPAVDGQGLYLAIGQDVIAIDLKNGQTLWRRSLAGPLTGSPALTAGLVLVGTHRGIVCSLDRATGQIIAQWSVGSSVPGHVAHDTTTAYAVSTDGRTHAIDLGSGMLRWQSVTLSPSVVGPAVAPDCIVTATRGEGVYALNPRKGATIWHATAPRPLAAQPLIVGDTVFVAEFSETGKLWALSLEKGEERGQTCLGSKLFGSPSVYGDTLLVATMGGQIMALE